MFIEYTPLLKFHTKNEESICVYESCNKQNTYVANYFFFLMKKTTGLEIFLHILYLSSLHILLKAPLNTLSSYVISSRAMEIVSQEIN